MNDDKQSEFAKKVFEGSDGRFRVLSNYVNYRTHVKISCTCGKVWNVRPVSVLKSFFCPKCDGSKITGRGKPPKTTDEFRKEIEEKFGDSYKILSKYESCMKPIKVIHNECGHAYMVTPNNLLKGYKCPNCYRSFKKTTDEFRKEVEKLKGKDYSFTGEYTNKKTKAEFYHKVCGRNFMMRPNDFLNGNGCSHCFSSQDSEGMRLIRNFFEENGVCFSTEVEFEGLRRKNNLRFDFCIEHPDTEEVIALVEFDGSQHFRPSFGKRNFKVQQERDSIKNRFAKENEVRLFRISYKDLNRPSFYRKLVEVQRLFRKEVGLE